MELKMLTGLSGPALSLSPRDKHDFNLPEAIRLVDAGFAEPTDREAYDAAVAKLNAEAGDPDADATAAAAAEAQAKQDRDADAKSAAAPAKAAPAKKPAAPKKAKP